MRTKVGILKKGMLRILRVMMGFCWTRLKRGFQCFRMPHRVTKKEMRPMMAKKVRMMMPPHMNWRRVKST